MKRINKINTKAFTHLVLMVLVTGLFFNNGCQKDETENMKKPEVSFIRVTDPAKSDSLITHAFMGSTIAIMGYQLENVDEIWFNDQKAFVNFSFVTSTSIIVTIPNVIPDVVTNQMLLINSNKIDTLKYPFGVDVPPPFLSGMVCEYVADGETAVIKGNFFIDDPGSPLQVFFPGNLPGTIESASITEIQVTVPDGTGVGPIQVKSIYGSTRSNFYFRDDRGIILDFDVKMGAGWRPGHPQSTNPDGISGNYAAMTGSLNNDWDWVEDNLAFELWGQAAGLPEGPLFEGNPSGMVMKFEAYVVNSWTGGWMQLIFSPWTTSNNSVNSDNNLARALWRPWTETGEYITEGWTTVTIPLTEFKYNPSGTVNNMSLVYPDNCGSLTFFVWGPVPEACDLFICIDNIRVVPK